MWTELGEQYIAEHLRSRKVSLHMSEFAFLQLLTLVERAGKISWLPVLKKISNGEYIQTIREFPMGEE